VAEDYANRMPFRFTGTLRRLVIELPQIGRGEEIDVESLEFVP
jgi:hypothetical protein